MEFHEIELSVMNSTTILTRVIQIITRRRVVILEFAASVKNENDEAGKIRIQVKTNKENVILLKNQFEKLVDVIHVA